MQFSNLVTNISNDLNLPLARFETIIKAKVNEACHDLHKTNNFYYGVEFYDYTWTAGVTSVSFSTLSSSFGGDLLEIKKVYLTDTGDIVNVINYAALLEARRKTQASLSSNVELVPSGTLDYYLYLSGTNLKLSQAQVSDLELTMQVKTELDDLIADTDVNYLTLYLVELVREFAKLKLANYLKDTNLINLYSNTYQTAQASANAIDTVIKGNLLESF